MSCLRKKERKKVSKENLGAIICAGSYCCDIDGPLEWYWPFKLLSKMNITGVYRYNVYVFSDSVQHIQI
jgi:hypothetical protein